MTNESDDLDEFLEKGDFDDATINEEASIEYIEIASEDNEEEWIDHVVVSTTDCTGEIVHTVFSRNSLKEFIQTLREADSMLNRMNKRRKG